MKILYIGPKMENPQNGGDRIEFRNQKLLEKFSDDNLLYFSPDFHYSSFYAKIALTIGLTQKKKKELKDIINNNSFDIIFVSQSLYGGYVKLIKSICTIPVITFFHNSEIDYFIDARRKFDPRGLYYVIKVIWSEYICVKKSDAIITLNERDSNTLIKHYKRGADCILPTSFDDVSSLPNTTEPLDIDYLFVGSCFFANTEGLQWFINNVMPQIKGELYIIGNGMDTFDFRNTNDHIHVIGFVKDLAEYYNRAKVVISPIFSGSGMKTKTAEALMYGKTILGTNEAFEGYVIDSTCMKLCNTADEFVTEINKIDTMDFKETYKNAREHFKKHYSNESAYKIISDFLLKFASYKMHT